jgi:hypothetical protein
MFAIPIVYEALLAAGFAKAAQICFTLAGF